MGRPLLRLHEDLAVQWGYVDVAAQLRKAEVPSEVLAAAEVFEPWVQKAIGELRKRAPRIISHPDKEFAMAIQAKASFDQNDVRSSYTDDEIGLAAHVEACAAKACVFAAGLPPLLVRALEGAAELHDIGKADPRFQAWLRGGNATRAGELIAKSAKSGQNLAAIMRARKLAGYPEGGRHELLSAALLSSAAARAMWISNCYYTWWPVITGDAVLLLPWWWMRNRWRSVTRTGGRAVLTDWNGWARV